MLAAIFFTGKPLAPQTQAKVPINTYILPTKMRHFAIQLQCNHAVKWRILLHYSTIEKSNCRFSKFAPAT